MLTHILVSDPAIEVVGTATNGEEAVDLVARLRPDLVTMDIHMPRMDGLEATERIMAFTPTPILVVSSSVYGEGMGRAFDALAAGALEVIKKPEPKDWADLETIGRQIIRTVKILSRVKVITHIRGRRTSGHAGVSHLGPPDIEGERIRIVAIGSSTGGPTALLEVLARSAAAFPAAHRGGAAHRGRFRSGARRVARCGVQDHRGRCRRGRRAGAGRRVPGRHRRQP